MLIWILLLVVGVVLAIIGAIAWAINRKVEWWHWVLIGVGAALILIGGIILIENWNRSKSRLMIEEGTTI